MQRRAFLGLFTKAAVVAAFPGTAARAIIEALPAAEAGPDVSYAIYREWWPHVNCIKYWVPGGHGLQRAVPISMWDMTPEQRELALSMEPYKKEPLADLSTG